MRKNNFQKLRKKKITDCAALEIKSHLFNTTILDILQSFNKLSIIGFADENGIYLLD